MGMYGYYFAIDDKLVQQIATGEIALENLKIEDYPGLDIDRSWEAIHYLLCGDIVEGEPPLSYVVPMTTEQAHGFPPLTSYAHNQFVILSSFSFSSALSMNSAFTIITRFFAEWRYIYLVIVILESGAQHAFSVLRQRRKPFCRPSLLGRAIRYLNINACSYTGKDT
ncbi:DUF1877 family protein [Paenibacillus lautus]|uniref:DUF1877 family protein n=1 Tax=Paenibacillus lautus TaxID=1401 RepID=UPI003D2C9A20